MLLNKIRLLKNKFNLLSEEFKQNKEQILFNSKKNSELEEQNKLLEKRVDLLEEFIKSQNFLNESTMNQIKSNELERIKIVKDIQIIVATLKDVYNLVQSSVFDHDIFDEDLIKKKKKNNTYH